jgi:hypothetical protein
MRPATYRPLAYRPVTRRIGYLTLILALASVGCHNDPTARVTLVSQDNSHVLVQRFARAYVSTDDAGQTNIVLVDDGHVSPTAEAQPSQAGAAPVLLPTRTPPLRQVLYLQVLWNAMPNVQVDAPSATNAVIDWVILAYSGSGLPDALHYQGAGFVRMDQGSKTVRVHIRNATLALKGRNGTDLEDPLGHCTLSGTFIATKNDDAVQKELDQARQEIAITEAGPVQAQEPPPRPPSGP